MVFTKKLNKQKKKCLRTEPSTHPRISPDRYHRTWVWGDNCLRADYSCIDSMENALGVAVSGIHLCGSQALQESAQAGFLD